MYKRIQKKKTTKNLGLAFVSSSSSLLYASLQQLPPVEKISLFSLSLTRPPTIQKKCRVPNAEKRKSNE